jgi:ATP-dependent Clp protease protease subunit
LRVTGIYGDINEEKCSETIYSLLILDNETSLIPIDLDDPESGVEEITKPIDFYISTFGGVAAEMFAVYDVMRQVREKTPIHTCGIGKVMSAGVLLLAAGTKGQRRIGKNCRVMIHGVVSGQHGHLIDVENEFEEAKLTQKLYVGALATETDMTAKYIKKLMDKKTNVYLDAAQAVDLGIADIIV